MDEERKHVMTFWNYCWALFFVILFALSILGLIFIQDGINAVIKSQVTIHQQNGYNTYFTNEWQSPTLDETMAFRVFDWVNADEVMRMKSKPSVRQLGPLNYRQTDRKHNITFAPKNNNGKQAWVMYQNTRSWYWYDEDQNTKCSNCNRTALVTIPNLVLQGIIAQLAGESTPNINAARSFNILSLLLGMKPYTTQPAQQIIFTGYVDPVLSVIDVLKKFPNIFKKLLSEMPPSTLMLTKAAIFYNYNGTNDGWYNISTGQIDITKSGQLNQWRHHSNLIGPNPEQHPWWTGNTARILNGSDNGELQPPFMKITSAPTVFQSYICRSFSLQSIGYSSFKGVTTNRYKIPDYFLNTSNPVEMDYGTANVSLPQGVIMPPCQPGQYFEIGTPVAFSGAHFDNAEASLKSSINFVVEKFDQKTATDFGYYDYKALLGAPMQIKFSIQANIPFKYYNADFISEHFSYYHLMKPVYIPLCWLMETVEVDDQLANFIITTTQTIPMIARATLYAIAGVSLLLFLLAITCPKMRNSCCVRKTTTDALNMPDTIIEDEIALSDNAGGRSAAMSISMKSCLNDEPPQPQQPPQPPDNAPIPAPRSQAGPTRLVDPSDDWQSSATYPKRRPTPVVASSASLRVPEKDDRFLSFTNDAYSSDDAFGLSDDEPMGRAPVIAIDTKL